MFPIFDDLHLVKSESGIGQLKFLNGIADGMKLWGILPAQSVIHMEMQARTLTGNWAMGV